jgi:Uma2 family endonuclease
MLHEPAVILDHDLDDEGLRIPAGLHTLERFRGWSASPAFPERGRIDYLEGDIEIDRSPEDLYTHGTPKTAIELELGRHIVEPDLGLLFIDRARIVSRPADLSVEPDLTVVLWSSLESGRTREVPAASQKEGRFVELEGPPDLVVEIVSDSSTRKDRRRLPGLYAKAGVPELWLIDARGPEVSFEMQLLGPEGYVAQPADPEGWLSSPLLGTAVRLTRYRGRMARWGYRLETGGSGGLRSGFSRQEMARPQKGWSRPKVDGRSPQKG